MAPIRLGDGTGIDSVRLGDGTAIDEVRTGDGQTVFSAVSIPDSAVNRWILDDNAPFADSIGSLDASNVGTQQVTNNYQGGAARSGDGSDHIQIDNGESLGNLLSSGCSIALTFETTDSNGYFWGSGGANETSWHVGMGSPRGGSAGNDELSFLIRDNSSDTEEVQAGPSFNDGSRYRVCAVKRGSSASDMEIWVDGNEQSVTIESNQGFSDGNVGDFSREPGLLGGRTDTGLKALDCVVDDVIIYDDALTSGEIQADYNLQPWS